MVKQYSFPCATPRVSSLIHCWWRRTRNCWTWLLNFSCLSITAQIKNMTNTKRLK